MGLSAVHYSITKMLQKTVKTAGYAVLLLSGASADEPGTGPHDGTTVPRMEEQRQRRALADGGNPGSEPHRMEEELLRKTYCRRRALQYKTVTDKVLETLEPNRSDPSDIEKTVTAGRRRLPRQGRL